MMELRGRDVSRETKSKLDQFARLLLAENQHQNLIARSTEAAMWHRHLADAAQLLSFAPSASSWVDIGSGAGLPGIVIAILDGGPVTLVEPRRLRAEFLARAIELLELPNVEIIQAKAEAVRHSPFDVITARAVASATRLFDMAAHLSHRETIWVLPKGRSAHSELDEARRTWQGEFRLEPSRTDAEAQILVASGVTARNR
jgi:16S rRNA (guanine527-N7)-methyltransferase